MDWGTVAALVVGAAISIISTFAATAGIEVYRELRDRKRRQIEVETERLMALQEDVVTLDFLFQRLTYSLRHRDLLSREEEFQLGMAIEERSVRIATMTARITDEDGRALIRELSTATQTMITARLEGKLPEALDNFGPLAKKVNKQLGTIIGKRTA